MSRKTSRNASENHTNNRTRLAPSRDSICANTELRRLALGSLAAAVSGALHAVFATSEKPRARHHYPKRHAWLDNALMAREMDRL